MSVYHSWVGPSKNFYNFCIVFLYFHDYDYYSYFDLGLSPCTEALQRQVQAHHPPQGTHRRETTSLQGTNTLIVLIHTNSTRTHLLYKLYTKSTTTH